ncbi:hypothetical protein K502DRAFT_350355 [Neoconidiobolus thromboides FSU 785]|nr:hypothetical protein K502DRAFT_350355 [Neoconidiobolus thromboides FSU 785]
MKLISYPALLSTIAPSLGFLVQENHNPVCQDDYDEGQDRDYSGSYDKGYVIYYRVKPRGSHESSKYCDPGKITCKQDCYSEVYCVFCSLYKRSK